MARGVHLYNVNDEGTLIHSAPFLVLLTSDVSEVKAG